MSWSVDCAHSWGSLLTRPRDQWQSTARGEPSLVDLQENRRTKTYAPGISTGALAIFRASWSGVPHLRQISAIYRYQAWEAGLVALAAAHARQTHRQS
jgi:hypothetical protein